MMLCLSGTGWLCHSYHGMVCRAADTRGLEVFYSLSQSWA